MQLKVSTDYAVRLLLSFGGESVWLTAEELSGKMAIPRPTVVKIMSRMKGKGWVKAREGLHGGYALNAPLSSISLLDIFQVMEETVRINRCLEEDEYCSRFAVGDCPVRAAYVQIQGMLERLFGLLTLDKVANRDFASLDVARAIGGMQGQADRGCGGGRSPETPTCW